MPIRPELRHFYRGEKWKAKRKEILIRAGGTFDLLGVYQNDAKCENCQKPDRTKVETISGRLSLGFGPGTPFMYWRTLGVWRNQFGCEANASAAETIRWTGTKVRLIQVVLAVIHLNNVSGDDRSENLKCCCQWCHLMTDQGQHKQSRSIRKDLSRPLLEVG